MRSMSLVGRSHRLHVLRATPPKKETKIRLMDNPVIYKGRGYRFWEFNHQPSTNLSSLTWTRCCLVPNHWISLDDWMHWMFLFKQLVGLSWYEFVREALLSWEPSQLGRKTNLYGASRVLLFGRAEAVIPESSTISSVNRQLIVLMPISNHTDVSSVAQ